MRIYTVAFGFLVACAAAMAVHQGDLLTDPPKKLARSQKLLYVVPPEENRDKRSLLLGAGLLGAAAVGAGVIGAGVLGAGILGAKAGFVGGALASNALYGRSYGGYYGTYYKPSYGYEYGVYGGYRSYYPPYYRGWW